MEPKRRTLDNLTAVQEELIRREPIFHRPELGTTRDVFEKMTANDFWETGASGRRYSRDFVLDTVVRRYIDGYKDDWRAEDFYCQLIAPNHYLLTYTLHQGKRASRRATLWRFAGNHWVALYHQGTIAENSGENASVLAVNAKSVQE